MMINPNKHYRLQGWVVSGLFHGLALTVAIGLMTQVKPVVPKEVFTWDVAMVEPQRIQKTVPTETKPTQEPATPTPRPVAPPPRKPQRVTQEVQTREVPPVVQREIRQAIETNQQIQETVAVQPRTEIVPQVQEEQSTEVTQAATVEQQTEHVIAESPSSVVAESELTKPAESVPQEPAPQVAVASSPAPVVKVDHGWLAELLRRRLAEIKRYPSTARLNGDEGKVVLRAVIRADGHLSEVKVHRSSGHEALDNAAIESIRLVCPLHMHQPLGTSEVAVYIPIVYSLGS
ncbi:MAG: TonB family protein [Nitrospirota bacterium]